MSKALARLTDPATSHDAASSLDEVILSRLQKIVLGALSNSGGLTVPEIAEKVGLPRDTISPRMPKLVEMHLVFDSGQKRVPPGHTRQCIVWKIAPHQLEMFA